MEATQQKHEGSHPGITPSATSRSRHLEAGTNNDWRPGGRSQLCSRRPNGVELLNSDSKALKLASQRLPFLSDAPSVDLAAENKNNSPSGSY
ncbi:hypothetical protein ACO22_02305 [Paracoccidioides brasiliensis]|uniref:Uncharacterized protein n=1 Tax=Paracoccidioides brasiliensis TaxID=121759 RepID=A0A1D2JJ62_PARBR|nr:hypothetical protein ACO22_02305 [Paracoccidioides brasiliensis]